MLAVAMFWEAQIQMATKPIVGDANFQSHVWSMYISGPKTFILVSEKI